MAVTDAINKPEIQFYGSEIDLDVVYFTTLMNNLLSNAVKYSDKKPEIEIEGFTAENNVCIKVADNGIGINRIDQKHIFDKFYRASTGNIHKFKGLGLGLYYVKKIAEAHGGDVTVSSRPGKGSTFTVILPRYDKIHEVIHDTIRTMKRIRLIFIIVLLYSLRGPLQCDKKHTVILLIWIMAIVLFQILPNRESTGQLPIL